MTLFSVEKKWVSERASPELSEKEEIINGEAPRDNVIDRESVWSFAKTSGKRGRAETWHLEV